MEVSQCSTNLSHMDSHNLSPFDSDLKTYGLEATSPKVRGTSI